MECTHMYTHIHIHTRTYTYIHTPHPTLGLKVDFHLSHKDNIYDFNAPPEDFEKEE